VTLSNRIIDLLERRSGLSDREITDMLFEPSSPQQGVNQACRLLAKREIISRRKRFDGRTGNFLINDKFKEQPIYQSRSKFQANSPLSENSLKLTLSDWLSSQGWQTKIAWGRSQGIDIEARRRKERWVIEVKGEGSRPQMRVNFFLTILGEIVQRMDDPKAKYSIALPNLEQYRRLWQRLPALAKSKLTITALFVDEEGDVKELS